MQQIVLIVGYNWFREVKGLFSLTSVLQFYNDQCEEINWDAVKRWMQNVKRACGSLLY